MGETSFYEVSLEGFKRKKPNRRRRTLFMQLMSKCVEESPENFDNYEEKEKDFIE
jgi:hypothetical protein